MLKLAAVVLVGALAAVAYLTRPSPLPPVEPEQLSPAGDFAVCPYVVSDDRTVTALGLAGVTPGAVTASFVNGGTSVETTTAVSRTGSGVVNVADVIGVGYSPVALEFAREPAATAFSEDPNALVASGCPSTIPPSWLLPGGSTRDQEDLTLVLANPFTGDALVAIDAASEAGVDTPSALQSVIVPARSTVVIDLAAEMALRQRLSVLVEAKRGLVVPALRQTGGSDVAAWEGSAPGNQWYLIVPDPGAGSANLILNTDSPVDIPFEVDLLTEGGETVLDSSTLPARGQIVVKIPKRGVGLRVFAEGDLAAVVSLEGEGVRATSPGSADAYQRWLLPAAGFGEAADHTMWVLNPTDHEIDLVVRSLGPRGEAFSTPAAASAVTEVGIDGLEAVLVEATEPVVVAFTISRSGAVAFGGGVALSG